MANTISTKNPITTTSTVASAVNEALKSSTTLPQPQEVTNPFLQDATLEPSIDEHAQKVAERVNRIKEAFSKANTGSFIATLSNEDIVQQQSKDGKFYEALTVDVSQVSTKGKVLNYKRTKPLFTDEAQLLAALIPFDPNASYRVTTVKKGTGDKKYSEWVKVEKVA